MPQRLTKGSIYSLSLGLAACASFQYQQLKILRKGEGLPTWPLYSWEGNSRVDEMILARVASGFAGRKYGKTSKFARPYRKPSLLWSTPMGVLLSGVGRPFKALSSLLNQSGKSMGNRNAIGMYLLPLDGGNGPTKSMPQASKISQTWMEFCGILSLGQRNPEIDDFYCSLLLHRDVHGGTIVEAMRMPEVFLMALPHDCTKAKSLHRFKFKWFIPVWGTLGLLNTAYPLPSDTASRLNTTMEEYIKLEEEKSRRHGKVFNWETATYGKIWDNKDVHDLGSVETEFPAIVFNETLTSKASLSCESTVSSLNNDEINFKISFDESDDEDCTEIFDKNSFSYKIIYVYNLKMDSKNDNDKVNMPLLPSPNPTVSYFNDLDYFNDFENEFPAIVYSDALTSKSDLLTEPILNPQHIDAFNSKGETSLSECDEEEQNILYFNDLFSFNVIYPDDSKSDEDNDDDKIDIKHSSGDLSVKPLRPRERNINEYWWRIYKSGDLEVLES
ncbi:hypothetical protein Tco_0392399 [Tanacetum coccineum]